MRDKGAIDVSSAAARRRFFLDRARRLNTRGTGSDLSYLMHAQPARSRSDDIMLPEIFDDIPILLIGAHAAAAFAPERFTKDTDYLVHAEHYDDATQRLRGAGWSKLRELVFPNAALGLLGSAWASPSGGNEVDLITSGQDWVREAFTAPPAGDASGKRVIPLAYLVLMKLDSARAIDQADLSRILGRLTAEDVAGVIRTGEAHYRDPSAADDIRRYHEIGKWEYEAGD